MNYDFMLCWNLLSTFFKSILSLKAQLSFFLIKMSNLFFFLFCTLIKTVLFCRLLYVTVKYCPICLLFFLVSAVFPPLRHLLPFSLVEAKRSQSISNCAHLYEALPTTKSVPMLLHTVSSFLPGISSGNSACSHRLSGKVHSESCMIFVCLPLPSVMASFH